jgi:hypothetical protein
MCVQSTWPGSPFALLLFLAVAPLWAQTRRRIPVLHRRGYNQVDDDLDMGTRSSGRTLLPLEASGEYSLGSGE